MRRLLLFTLAMLFLSTCTVKSQTRILRKVTNSVADGISGTPRENPKNNNSLPDPACACKSAELILNLGNELHLMYSEVSIEPMNDGTILIKDRISQKYYVVKDGKTEGPYSEGDPHLSAYLASSETDEKINPLLIKYKNFITPSGEKFLIKFNGKSYGPYAEIKNFVVTKSGDKFAADVVENVSVTEDQGKKMDEAMKKAKSDKERMELAMKFSQEMQQRMMAGGGPSASMPKMISNIEGINFDPLTGGSFSGDMKYDDILVTKYDVITDLKGNKIMPLKPEYAISTSAHIFVNTTNTKYAVYDYGTVNFSDGTSMSDLFNVRLVKTNGIIYLAYMYYSPGKNSIMQCKIQF